MRGAGPAQTPGLKVAGTPGVAGARWAAPRRAGQPGQVCVVSLGPCWTSGIRERAMADLADPAERQAQQLLSGKVLEGPQA